jgi:hypothetical protein
MAGAETSTARLVPTNGIRKAVHKITSPLRLVILELFEFAALTDISNLSLFQMTSHGISKRTSRREKNSQAG